MLSIKFQDILKVGKDT